MEVRSAAALFSYVLRFLENLGFVKSGDKRLSFVSLSSRREA